MRSPRESLIAAFTRDSTREKREASTEGIATWKSRALRPNRNPPQYIVIDRIGGRNLSRLYLGSNRAFKCLLHTLPINKKSPLPAQVLDRPTISAKIFIAHALDEPVLASRALAHAPYRLVHGIDHPPGRRPCPCLAAKVASPH